MLRLKKAYVLIKRMHSAATWFHIASATGICGCRSQGAESGATAATVTNLVDSLTQLERVVGAETVQEVGNHGQHPIPAA